MMILAVDTSSDSPVIAILQLSVTDGTCDVIASVASERSQHLLSAIDDSLEDAGMQRSDIECVAVGMGPGAFTSLRIGAATGNGIAAALGVPAVGFSSLLAVVGGWDQANTSSRGSSVVTGCIDAKRGEIFFQKFEVGTPTGSNLEVTPLGSVEVAGEDRLSTTDSDGVVWGPPSAMGIAVAVRHALAANDGSLKKFAPVVPEYGREPDAKPVAQLRTPSFEQVPSIVGLLAQSRFTAWTHEMVSAELQRPAGESYSCIIVDGSNVVGCVFAALIGDDWHLLNICVARSHRRCGFGRTLVNGLLDRADKEGRLVTLEVAERSAGAIALYVDVGFTEVGRRTGYYGDEDALIMTRPEQSAQQEVGP